MKSNKSQIKFFKKVIPEIEQSIKDVEMSKIPIKEKNKYIKTAREFINWGRATLSFLKVANEVSN